MRSTDTAYRGYARARTRALAAQEDFAEAERAYIDALLHDRGLELGDPVQPENGAFVIRIDDVVVDGRKGILSVKGPVLKNDGTFSEGRKRILMVQDSGMVPFKPSSN
jgi:hypothetical protein